MWKGLRGSEEGVDDVEEGVGGTDVVVVVSMASARAVVNVEKREVAIFFIFFFLCKREARCGFSELQTHMYWVRKMISFENKSWRTHRMPSSQPIFMFVPMRGIGHRVV